MLEQIKKMHEEQKRGKRKAVMPCKEQAQKCLMTDSRESSKQIEDSLWI